MIRRKYLRYLVYTIVTACYSAVMAGSYDDFFIAVRNDNVGTVNEMLDQGFDPNARDAKGQPGLTVAMRENAAKVAKSLLARKSIDVNALNQAGESALMMAALKGDMQGTEMLLDRGARVNQPGWTPLHYAATGPNDKIVALLIDRGASVDAASPNGTTPLMMAAQYGSEDNVKVLLQRGADPKLRNQRNLDVVDFAKLSGREPLVRALERLPR